MFDGVARWWDGFELWLAQQWFPIQFALVAAVLLPLCAGAAWVVQRGVDLVADRVDRGRVAAARGAGGTESDGRGPSDGDRAGGEA